jgi:glycosyltransferase involved in cell wall biosynthesis
VTHHWSNNPSKGFDRYAQIDALIADGTLKDWELWVIGRWPESLRWKSVRTFPACTGQRLGDLLRECDVYVSASRHEPGAMHVAEGLQCGLPILYTGDSGGTVESGKRFGIELGDDIPGALNEMRTRYPELRAKLVEQGPSGDFMCMSYARLIQKLVFQGEKR